MKRTFLRNKASLRQALTTAIKNFTIEKEIIVNTLESYTTFHEKFERKIKDEKILNNFLADLPSTGQIIEVSDLERHVQAKIRKFSEDSKVLTDFIQAVKSECIVDNVHFNFFEIPDMIVRKRFTKEQYEKVKSLLLKVKAIYLMRKAEKLKEDKENKDKNTSFMMDDDDDVSARKSQSAADKDKDVVNEVITDEDLVPLEYLDQAVANKEKKENENIDAWKRFIKECVEEKKEKSDKQGASVGPKKKKLVEQAVFAEILNNKLEKAHVEII